MPSTQESQTLKLSPKATGLGIPGGCEINLKGPWDNYRAANND